MKMIAATSILLRYEVQMPTEYSFYRSKYHFSTREKCQKKHKEAFINAHAAGTWHLW